MRVVLPLTWACQSMVLALCLGKVKYSACRELLGLKLVHSSQRLLQAQS